MKSLILPDLHLFGSSTPCGHAFRMLAAQVNPTFLIHLYSRNRVLSDRNSSAPNTADFLDPSKFWPAGKKGEHSIWISVAPIWLFAEFFSHLADQYPERLVGLRAVVACSSSSVITKRFAFNSYDRDLANRLDEAEQLLFSTCSHLGVTCHIIQPTLVYGQSGSYGDRNLSILLKLLRRLPILPLPATTGLRQPIHANQLASAILHLVVKLAATRYKSSFSNCIALGGDSTLTYYEMINALQKSQPLSDPARRCLLIPIPNRLFFFLAAPLLFRSTKDFEALLRMGANLSGFPSAHSFLGCDPEPFPILPLA